jgi:hypothetical protein
MKFWEPTKLHRKSGMWGTRRLLRGQKKRLKICVKAATRVFEYPEKKPQVPPLRFAPVGMTILLCPQKL